MGLYMKADFYDLVFEGNNLRADAVDRLEAAFSGNKALLDADENNFTCLHQLAICNDLNANILKPLVEKIIQLKPGLLQVRWNGRMLPIESAVEQGVIPMLDALAPYYKDSILERALKNKELYERAIKALGVIYADLKIFGQVNDTLMSYALRIINFEMAQALHKNGFTRLNGIAVSDNKEASIVLGEIANTFFLGKSSYDKEFCAFIKDEVIKKFKVSQLKDALVANAANIEFVRFVNAELDKRPVGDRATTRYDYLTLLQSTSPFLHDYRKLSTEEQTLCKDWLITEEEFVDISSSSLYLLGSSFGKEAKEAGAVFHEFKIQLSQDSIRRYFLKKILNQKYRNNYNDLDLNWVNKLADDDIKLLTANDDIRKYLVDNYQQLQAGLVAAENGEAATLQVVNAYLDNKFGKTNKQIVDIKCLRDESRDCFLSCLKSGIDPRELVDSDGVITNTAVIAFKAYSKFVSDEDSHEYKTAMSAWIEGIKAEVISKRRDCAYLEFTDAFNFRRIFKDNPSRLNKAHKVLGQKITAIGALSSDRIDVLLQDGIDVNKFIELNKLIPPTVITAENCFDLSNVWSANDNFDLARDAKKCAFLLRHQSEVNSLKDRARNRDGGRVKEFKEILNLSVDAIAFKFAYEKNKKMTMYGRYCSWSDLAKVISEHKIGALSYGVYSAKCHIKQNALPYAAATPFALIAAATCLYIYTGIDVVQPVINTVSLAKDHASKLLQPSIGVIRTTLHI